MFSHLQLAFSATDRILLKSNRKMFICFNALISRLNVMHLSNKLNQPVKVKASKLKILVEYHLIYTMINTQPGKQNGTQINIHNVDKWR